MQSARHEAVETRSDNGGDVVTPTSPSQDPGDERSAVATSAEVAHLLGAELPGTRVPATGTPDEVSLRDLAGKVARLVIYGHPAIGAPDRDLITPDWMSIPGAFGCTAESCSFRDLNTVIQDLGAAVCGLSTQQPAEQRAAAQRLSLTFPLLSDHVHTVTDQLRLPTWFAGGQRLLKRFTIVTSGPVIEHVFASVPDPATHADEVAGWLRENPHRPVRTTTDPAP